MASRNYGIDTRVQSMQREKMDIGYPIMCICLSQNVNYYITAILGDR